MIKVLVDTNVLVYSHQKEAGKKHEICAAIVNGLIDRDEIVISVQNLVEFSRVLSEKASPPLDKELIRQYVFDFSQTAPVIYYNDHTIMDALSLSKQYGIHFFDALLVATMQENGISKILTENSDDFKKIPGLEVENPFKR